ncbi:MAG TPA: carboxypeptidase regulatory-like domain-containing protein [Bryobacteraceae bacterium]
MRSGASLPLLLPLLLSTAFGQAPQGFTLAGVVVQDGTNQPLNHALVTIRTQGKPVRQAMYLTAANGGFAFLLPAGKYELTAMKEGYPRQSYLEDEGFSTAIVVGPAIDSAHIVFPLKAPCTISGTVFDDRGDPVRQALVHLLKKSVVQGRLRVRQSGQKMTDSSGGFSFDGLAPGIYLLGVSGRPWYAINSINRNPGMPVQDTSGISRDVAYPLTYYSDTIDPAAATPIEISEGTQAKVQITLHAVPAVHVNMTGGDIQSGRGMNAQVFALGPDGVQIRMNAFMGWFSGQANMSGLAPGRYVLDIQSFNAANGGRAQQLGSKLVDLDKDTTLDPSEPQKISISGKLTVEGSGASGEPVTLNLRNEGGGQFAQTTVAADGSFTFETDNLRLGQYSVGMSNAAGLYLKSIAATGAKYSNGELDVTGGDVQLTITASTAVKELSGLAVKDDKPFAGAMILLLPKNGGMPSQTRRDQSDSDGSFTLKDVVPGSYLLLAIDDGRQFAYQDAAVMKPYLPHAQTLTVPADGQLKVNVMARQR